MKVTLHAASLLLASAPLLAQGADNCASATPITGNGPFLADTTAATTDGLPDPTCDFFGNQDIFNDVWFAWTANQGGPHILDLCGMAGSDSKAAIYDGACGSAVTWCNDDACGLFSQVNFDAVAGQTYLLRIGNYSAAGTPVNGTFTVDYNGPVLNPGNGNWYQVVNDNTSWTAASAAAQAAIFNGAAGHLVTITTQAELDWMLANLTFDRPWIGYVQNLNSPSYSEPGGGWEWVTGETGSLVNWAPGEPNDTSASAGPENYAEMFGSGVWNDAEDNHTNTFQYIIEWEGGSIGTNYCNANPNSTGVAGSMSASGSATVAMDDFTLEASDLPNQQFGIFIVSRLQGFVPNAGGTSNGNLCLGGNIGRFVQANQIKSTGMNGAFSLQIPLTQIPQGAGVVAVVPGDTWNFQAWHREGVGLGSNFTDGLSVTFQ